MNAHQGSNDKACIDQEFGAESKSTLPDEYTVPIASDLLCCVCRQMLDDPMLLCCLHSCCRRCLKSSHPINESSKVAPLTVKASDLSKLFGFSDAPTYVSHQTSSSMSSVRCQTCMETTSVAAAVDNVLLAGKVKVLKVLRTMTTCAFCGDEQDGDAGCNASFWCVTCQSTMCAECVAGHSKFHKTHSTISLHEMQCSDRAIGASTVSCVKHERPYEFACFTCETAKCLSCAADCIATRHDALLLSDPRYASRFARLKLKVTNLASSVSKKSAVLHQHVGMAERLRAAREADLDQLKANKRLVVDAIDQAYQEAEAALKDGYDELEAKALKLRHAAEPQLERMRNAVDYSQRLLAADDAFVTLMQQQKLVVSKLKALLKMLDSTPTTRDASAFFRVPKCMERTVRKRALESLPTPRLQADDLCIDMPEQSEKIPAIATASSVGTYREHDRTFD